MNHRRVVTENSVWIFDLDLMRYLRLPKTEGEAWHPNIPYTGEWDDFTELQDAVEFDMPVLYVYRPVEWGSGAIRRTSPILEDSHGPQTT